MLLTNAGSKEHDTLRPRVVLRYFQPVETIIVSAVEPMTFHMLERWNLFKCPFQLLQR